MDLEQLFLCKLAEECNEVAKICLKAQQFGLDYVDPETGKTNAELLVGELEDVSGVVLALNNDFNLGYVDSPEAKMKKVDKILKYMKMSENLGRVTIE